MVNLTRRSFRRADDVSLGGALYVQVNAKLLKSFTDIRFKAFLKKVGMERKVVVKK